MSNTHNIKRQDIEIAKGIGIILVIIGHVQAFGPVYDTIYLFHMPLFFVIAGLFLRPEDSIKKFMSKKYYRLIEPIIYYSFILIPLYVIYTILANFPNLTIKQVLYAIKPFNYDVPLWFSVVLFVTLALLQYPIRKRNLKVWLIYLFFCLIITEFIVIGWVPYVPYFAQIFLASLFVGFGYVLKKVLLSNNIWYEVIIVTVSVLLMVWAILNHIEFNINAWIVNKNVLVNLLVGLSGSYIVIFLSRMMMNRKIAKPLLYLGENSFPIYCLHWPMVRMLWSILPPPIASAPVSYIIIRWIIYLVCITLFIPLIEASSRRLKSQIESFFSKTNKK